NCPTCGVGLDYEHSRQPNSAEVDHIIPHSLGGEDSLANTQIICRWCNQRKGNGTQRRKPMVPKRLEPKTGVPWWSHGAEPRPGRQRHKGVARPESRNGLSSESHCHPRG